MGIKVGEFFIDLAVDAASGNLSVKQLIGAMGELEVASLGGTYGIAKVVEKLYNMGHAAAETAVDLLSLRDVTGADPKMVQRWELAGQRIGISAGAIKSSIKSVGDTMAAISQMRASPPELLTRFGIIPSMSKDAGKVYSDLMQKVAGNKDFWSNLYGPRERISFLKTMGLGEEDLRILQEMRGGRWRPDTIKGLSGKQMEDFKNLSRTTTEIMQLMTDIASRLILHGGTLEGILERAKNYLVKIDDILHADKDEVFNTKGVGYFFKGIRDIVSPAAYNIVKSPGLEAANRELFRAAQSRAAVQADFGTLNVKVTGPKGEQAEHKFRIDRSIKNRNTEDASINLSLEGK